MPGQSLPRLRIETSLDFLHGFFYVLQGFGAVPLKVMLRFVQGTLGILQGVQGTAHCHMPLRGLGRLWWGGRCLRDPGQRGWRLRMLLCPDYEYHHGYED